MIPVEQPRTEAEKKKAAKEADASIKSKYGEGAIFCLEKNSTRLDIPFISTGIYSLDNDVLAIGGIPRGRVTELFGPESSGKTTLALKIIASAQKEGGLASFIDVENSLDPIWARLNGVDTEALRVSQPDGGGEEALDIASLLIESGAFSIVVIDSVAALTPKSELEGDIGDSNMGLMARMMSQALRMLSGKVRRSGTSLVFINQLRDRIGISYGDPSTTSGGRALKFYSSVRLDVRKIQTIKEDDIAIGNMVRIKAVKNKVGVPYRQVEVDLLFDRGFNSEGNLLDTAAECDIINKSGAWYSFGGERLGQGRTNAVAAFKQQPELQKKVLALLNEKRNKPSEATSGK